MKNFEMALPNSVDEAAGLLPKTIGDDRARLLAGGQDLLTEMKEYLVEPELVVNLKSIPDLDGVVWASDGSLEIGALTTLASLEQDASIAAAFPALVQAASSIASPQIRSAATVGGNLNQRPRCWYYRSEDYPCLKKGGTECFSYYGKNRYNAILGGGPSYIVHPSDLAPALVALGAEVQVISPRGERVLTLEEFFVLPSEGDVLRETRLAADEVLTRIRVPAPASGQRSIFLKFKERDAYDFALAAVALVLQTDGDRLASCRLVLGAVAPVPWRCTRTERKLAGRPLGEELVALAAQDALADAEPLSENGYKVPLTQGLIAEAFEALTT
jgi:xanthine dehydrogenase YagS FAD-binding subunit